MDVSYSIVGTTPNAPGTAVVGAPAVFATYLDMPESLDVEAALVGATNGTLDLYLQTSPDAGTTWCDYAHFAQLAGGAAASFVRFGVARHAQATTITTVGRGLAPALAVNTVLGGPFGDRMRLVAVAGGGTTLGATITILLRAQGVQRFQPGA